MADVVTKVTEKKPLKLSSILNPSVLSRDVRLEESRLHSVVNNLFTQKLRITIKDVEKGKDGSITVSIGNYQIFKVSVKYVPDCGMAYIYNYTCYFVPMSVFRKKIFDYSKLNQDQKSYTHRTLGFLKPEYDNLESKEAVYSFMLKYFIPYTFEYGFSKVFKSLSYPSRNLIAFCNREKDPFLKYLGFKKVAGYANPNYTTNEKELRGIFMYSPKYISRSFHQFNEKYFKYCETNHIKSVQNAYNRNLPTTSKVEKKKYIIQVYENGVFIGVYSYQKSANSPYTLLESNNLGSKCFYYNQENVLKKALKLHTLEPNRVFLPKSVN